MVVLVTLVADLAARFAHMAMPDLYEGYCWVLVEGLLTVWFLYDLLLGDFLLF